MEPNTYKIVFYKDKVEIFKYEWGYQAAKILAQADRINAGLDYEVEHIYKFSDISTDWVLME